MLMADFISHVGQNSTIMLFQHVNTFVMESDNIFFIKVLSYNKTSLVSKHHHIKHCFNVQSCRIQHSSCVRVWVGAHLIC